ncbi:sugar/nucleoside kinase (ribokinase family) [Mycetocola sp. CAN_C7]|uniref:carbohydrate kinase family protein n=1 Tax=Mycetocola sp. CAN_C7 TaxID=2787724 RepID=UPI001A2CD905
MAETEPAEFDVVLAGPVFFDIIFTGLDSKPSAGTEVWASGMGSSPGGIANLAVAASRLGLRTALASVFGDDVYGRWCWDVLSSREGVDLSQSRLLPDWHTAVTVSVAEDGDRSMVTHGHDSPISDDTLLEGGIRSRAALADLGAMSSDAAGDSWWLRAARNGTRIFADIGWDSAEAWDPNDLAPLESCYAFTPNSREAMAYTRQDTPLAAARALAKRVPLVVVTCGSDGAIAIDSETGEQISVPSVPVTALDATGAGDVFAGSFVLGTLRDWPLEQRLSFSALCSALAVQHFGGSLAAPGWGDIADWWDRIRLDGDRDLAKRYGFLSDLLPAERASAVRRAEATFYLTDHLPTSEPHSESPADQTPMRGTR